MSLKCKIFYFCFFSFVFSASGALADCVTSGTSFYVAQNDGITYDMVVTHDGRCEGGYRSGGTSFTSATITENPINGTIQTNGISNYIYTARLGFKGQDRFKLRICGKNLAGSGCSIITYNLDVKEWKSTPPKYSPAFDTVRRAN
jgi:hypothetical protein